MQYEQLLAKIAKQWIAGNKLDDAIDACKIANRIGIHGIINYLGEHIRDQSMIKHTIDQYLTLLDKIDELRLDASISIKPTQIGLDLSIEEYHKNLDIIIESADSHRRFVWIDMESSRYIDDTIDTYLEYIKSYNNIGIAIQAYLRNVIVYASQLIDANASIRLTKGAYREDPSIVFKSKDLIDKSYISIMQLLFKTSRNNFAIATHDQKIIELALRLSLVYRSRFEFQMLRGIRDDLKSTLVARGYSVGEYIPYGDKILKYSMRRIREHPTNILLLMRSMI